MSGTRVLNLEELVKQAVKLVEDTKERMDKNMVPMERQNEILVLIFEIEKSIAKITDLLKRSSKEDVKKEISSEISSVKERVNATRDLLTKYEKELSRYATYTDLVQRYNQIIAQYGLNKTTLSKELKDQSAKSYSLLKEAGDLLTKGEEISTSYRQRQAKITERLSFCDNFLPQISAKFGTAKSTVTDKSATMYGQVTPKTVSTGPVDPTSKKPTTK